MKLQIDTEEKTIKLENDVLLFELFKKVKILFPNDSWKEFKLLTGSIINWTNPYPIIIREYEPYKPYPWIYYGGSTAGQPSGNPYKVSFNSGVYNVELYEQEENYRSLV